MSYKRHALDRPLYTPAVVADITELNPRTLAAYEELGLIEADRASSPPMYSGRTVKKIGVIRELTHELGLNLQAVALTLDLFDRLLEAGGVPSTASRHAFEEYRQAREAG